MMILHYMHNMCAFRRHYHLLFVFLLYVVAVVDFVFSVIVLAQCVDIRFRDMICSVLPHWWMIIVFFHDMLHVTHMTSSRIHLHKPKVVRTLSLTRDCTCTP